MAYKSKYFKGLQSYAEESNIINAKQESKYFQGINKSIYNSQIKKDKTEEERTEIAQKTASFEFPSMKIAREVGDITKKKAEERAKLTYQPDYSPRTEEEKLVDKQRYEKSIADKFKTSRDLGASSTLRATPKGQEIKGGRQISQAEFETQFPQLSNKGYTAESAYREFGKGLKPFLGRFTGSATAGVSDVLGGVKRGEEMQRFQNLYPGSTTGTLAGYVAPGTVATKLSAPLVKGVARTIPKLALQEAIAGGGMELAEGMIRGESAGDVAKRTAFGTVSGGAGGALFGKLGQIATKGRKSLSEAFESPFKGASDFVPSQYKPKQILSQPITPFSQTSRAGQRVIDDPLLPRVDKPKRTLDIQTREPEMLTRPIQEPRIETPTKVTPDPTYTKYKTVAELPNDTQTLETIVREMQEAQNKGLKVDLQLFGEAQRKLKQFKSTTMVEPRIITEGKSKKPIIDRLKETYTKWVDSNLNIKPASKKAYIQATNTKKVGGTVSNIFNDDLVDASGKKIGSSLKNITKEIKPESEEEFLRYMLMKHNIARHADGKPIYSMYSPEKSSEIATQILNKNPEFKVIETNLRKFLDEFSNEWLVNSGLVAQDVMEDMRKLYPNYLPTQRVFSDIETGGIGGAKKGFVSQPSTIKKATGSDRDINNPIINIMNMVNKTVRTARKNQVAQTILKEVRDNPVELKRYAEILPTTSKEAEAIKVLMAENIDEVVDETGNFIHPTLKPTKANVVTVLEDGQPVYLQINDKKLLEALTGATSNDFQANPKLKAFMNIFKGLITQKNPFFAVRNIARDIPTAYVYGSESNPFKFARNLIKATKKVATNDDIYKQYKAMGGADSQFFNPEKATKYKDLMNSKPNIFKKFVEGIEYFNALTETAPRLAEFEKVLKDTGDVQKALFEAGEITTNFSRGGKSAKTVDSLVPYFNASVQGLDRMARGIKDKPIRFALRGLAGITLPTIALHMINKDNPDYQELNDRTRDTNYLIPIGNGKFIKIPKSRELGVIFGSLFERIISQNLDNYMETVLTNFSPANPIENIASPLLNLRSNKDFANRSIVPMNLKDYSPRYQYDERTSSIAKALGNMANLSPKQIDYILRSYTGVIGQILQPATTKGTSPFEVLVKRPFTADTAYSSKTVQTFYDNLDNLRVKAKDKNLIENIPSEIVTEEEKYKNAVSSISSYFSKLNKDIRNIKNKNQQRNERLNINKFLKDTNKALESKDLDKILNIKKAIRDKYNKTKK